MLSGGVLSRTNGDYLVENKDGSKETRTSTLCDYGDPNGYSSMAKLVGVPCGVAVKQVLDGTISEKVGRFPLSTSFVVFLHWLKPSSLGYLGTYDAQDQ